MGGPRALWMTRAKGDFVPVAGRGSPEWRGQRVQHLRLAGTPLDHNTQ